MDQFILNLFQEHLSKIIIGFRKEQVDANLFNGKGEIRNIEINCSIINEQLRHLTPYVEFERIHISNLSFHVSSWTNLRNSPIRIDIDHIQVTIVEPFYYESDKTKRKRIRQVTVEELTQLMKDGVIPKPRQSSYNLLDRILDNLVIEIRSVHITYQPYGIFKTRRTGPWTPPTLLIQFFGTRWITIDEYGFEIQNNNISNNKTTQKSRHPHHKRKDGSFHIDKRLETDYKISLMYSRHMSHQSSTTGSENIDSTTDKTNSSYDQTRERETSIIPIVSSSSSTFNGHYSNTSTLLDPRKKVNVHFIIQRRIRDGEYLAVQIDVIIPLVEVLLLRQERQPTNSLSNAQKLSALVHFLTAMKFCLIKDRAFVDPLRPVGREQSSITLPLPNSGIEISKEDSIDFHEVSVTTIESQASQEDVSTDNPKPDTGLPLPILDLTQTDGLSDSSSDEDEDEDNKDYDKYPTTVRHEVGNTIETSILPNALDVLVGSTTTVASTETEGEHKPVTTPPKDCTSGRPLLVFSNGMIVHDKFSFSLNIEELQMSGQYDNSAAAAAVVIDGDYRLKANGVVIEMIWPIATMEKGVYIQMSLSLFSLHERCGNRIRPLLLGGCEKNDFLGYSKQSTVTEKNGEMFPLYEDRSVRPDKFDFRQTHRHQAFGIKLTVTDTKRRPPVQKEQQANELLLFPEVGIDSLELTVDASAWTRIARFTLNLDSERYDPRWWTGDYRQSVSSEMLIPSNTSFAIDDYLQASERITRQDMLFPLESFESTIRLTNLAIRVPAVTDNIIMSCDAILLCKEMIMKISHDLPQTLVKNDVTTEKISFPNDPSDLELQPQQHELPSTLLNEDKCNQISTLGFHSTFLSLSLTLVPIIPLCPSRKPEQLLLPTDIELLLHLEAKDCRVAGEDTLKGIAAAIHVLVHEFEVNLDLDLLATTLGNAFSHYKTITNLAEECRSLFLTQNSVTDIGQQQKDSLLEHVDQCWKHGNISTCFSIRVKMSRLCLWRQNVLRHQPMSHNPASSIELSPLLLTADLVSKDIAINFYTYKAANRRRIVVTFSVQELSFAVCNFDRMLKEDVFWVEIHSGTSLVHGLSYAENPMVEMFSIGLNEGFCRALDLRIEADSSEKCSYTFSADVADGIISSNVESISTVVLLILDAFSVAFPTFHPNESANVRVSNKHSSKQSSNDELSMSTKSVGSKTVLEWYNTLISTKSGMDVLLIRVGFKNMQVVLSDGQRNDEYFTIELFDSTMMLCYFSPGNPETSKLLDRFATGQSKWSSLVEREKKCLYHTLTSRQSIQFSRLKRDKDKRQADMESAISTFQFAYTYYQGKLEISTSDDFASGCTENLIKCFVTLQGLFHRSQNEVGRIVGALYSTFNKSNSASIHKEYKGNSGNPIYHACAATESAIKSLKNLSLVMQNKINALGKVAEMFRVEKNDEIGKLRVLFLSKESEHLRLHALVSSEATGWLRAGKQRSGLRGSITCTLWRHWVVLRRSALVLFTCPGQGIAHIVFLDGAVLHDVSGGSRKYDLKRAFALVERTGDTHIFIAGCDDEYITWVNAIATAINAHSKNSLKSPSDESDVASIDDSTKTEMGQLSRSIAKVVQATKAKGQAAIARTMKQTVLVPDSDLAHKGTAIPATNVTESQMDSGGSINISVAPRMSQIRNRIAGVSQVTKGRLGSSLSAAKQKGREAIQRRLLSINKSANDAMDAPFAEGDDLYTDHSMAKTWECQMCLSLNMLDLVKCKTCESIRSDIRQCENTPATNTVNFSNFDQAQDFDGVGTPPSAMTDNKPVCPDDNESKIHVDDQNDVSEFLDDNESKSESSIKNRLSAVVRRAKFAPLGRKTAHQESQYGTVVGTAQGQKIGNIELNGRLRVSKYPFGEDTNQIQELPMKKIDGTWGVMVKALKEIQPENGVQGKLQDTDMKNPCKPVVLDANHVPPANINAQSPFTDQTLGLTNMMDGETRSNSSDLYQFVDIVFIIRVIKYNVAGSSIEPNEFTRNLSEIGMLHATLSESIRQLPPYKFETSVGSGECGSPEAPSTSLQHPSFLDSLLISGRVLGDLLDLQHRVGATQIESISNYSAVFIEMFLNEIVNSPLPGDCLAYVKDFLQLFDEPMNDAATCQTRGHHDEGPINHSLTNCSNVISQLSAELVKACDQNLVAMKIVERMQRKCTAIDETMSLQANQPSSLSLLPYQLSGGVYSVLNEVMLERDEAQSRLTLAEILYRTERDEQHIRINDLTSQLEATKQKHDMHREKNHSNEERAANPANTRYHDHANKAIYDSDIELQSLCQQLAGEISARTAAEISIVRMKESRKLEQEFEAAERQALQDEVVRLRELVQQMRSRETEILEESRRWRESFEAVVHFRAENAAN